MRGEKNTRKRIKKNRDRRNKIKEFFFLTTIRVLEKKSEEF